MGNLPGLCALVALGQAAGDPPAADEQEIERALEADLAGGKTAAPAVAGGGVRLPGAFNPEISVVTDVALAAFSRHGERQTGAHDPRRTGFNLQQLELALSSAVDPYFRFDAHLVFGQFGVELEDAYATTLALPANLQVRAGQFLTRFGRLNPMHPHAWDFVDQPFVLGRLFGGEGNRGLGIEGSWLAPLPWYVELVASSTDAAGEGTARSFYGGRDLGVRSPLDLQTTLVLEQFFPLSDDWSVLWGLSSAFGPNATGHGNRTDVYGTDVHLRWRPVAGPTHRMVSLQAEWLYRRRQVPEDVLQDTGGYASLFWRFAARWGAAVRWELGSASWDLAGRRRGDDLDPEWTTARQRVSAALTFWPTEFSRLRLQGARDAGAGEEAGWAAFLALEVVVGAHGAHPF